MKLDKVLCGDFESDGLLDTVTKIHVFSIGWVGKDNKWKLKSTNDYDTIRKVLSDPNNVIAIHNGVQFDVPLAEKVLGIKVKAEIIDTLAVAWYIDCNRGKMGKKYGLAYYGEDFGVHKPEVEDWIGLTYEEYKHRCEEDVKITIKTWEFLLKKLRSVYDSDGDIVRIIRYLNFIMLCARKQEEQKIKADIEKTKSNLAHFEQLKAEKFDQLKLAMPKVPKIVLRNKPKKLYNQKGDLTVLGEKWFNLLESGGYPQDWSEPVEVIVDNEEANPNSVDQKKAWLYSLGWKPTTFKHNRNKETGEVKKVEQIMTEEKELCPSVLKLKDKEPAIELLDGLTVLSHRIGLLKGILKNADENGYIVQGLSQLAVTLRWQHSVIVNFPRYTGKGDVRDGRWIRECIIAGIRKKIVQSDLSGIESRTSDHYTFHINPDRIKKTKEKYFDPHTEIAVASNLMTPDEEIWFKWTKENKDRKEAGEEPLSPETFGTPSDVFHLLQNLEGDEAKKLMDRLKMARSKGKTTNYASLYLVGANTLSRNLEISKKEAQNLIDGYWKINYAVKKFSESLTVKKVNGENWILNPINKFWYNLRNEKDRFSVVNQSSAVYCFNMWVYNVSKFGIFPNIQNHDDLALVCDESKTEEYKGILEKAMENLNKQLKLNIEIACEIQVGDNLAETH
jgi:hypothetical protein